MEKRARSGRLSLIQAVALLAVGGCAALLLGLAPGNALAAAKPTPQNPPGSALGFVSPATVQHAQFIVMAGAAAIPSQVKFGVPAAVTVAQAILESNWGTSQLAIKTKNHFGMKCNGPYYGPIANGCAQSPTWECAKDKGCYGTTAMFRTYGSVADSFADHGNKLYVSDRYKSAFKYSNDPDQFIREVHKDGYATDPQYSDKVIGLMNQYNLYKFDSLPKKVSTITPPAASSASPDAKPSPTPSAAQPAKPSAAPSSPPAASKADVSAPTATPTPAPASTPTPKQTPAPSASSSSPAASPPASGSAPSAPKSSAPTPSASPSPSPSPAAKPT